MSHLLPADDLDLQGVVEAHVRVVHHHIDTDHTIHFIGGDEDWLVDTLHVVVEELPTASVFH